MMKKKNWNDDVNLCWCNVRIYKKLFLEGPAHDTWHRVDIL